ncbi:hypothetical protein Ahy_B01g057154 isoform A [Arachis hypogaea]|uniref:Uncharacterized protein n=1 Tax=Arachis hypogaea TaxID=3818 RepID=A0A445B0D8_ARAHY|nr:hypothetical protein Ahy_B01g057154 isoform A [Arachis hypogaea]
MELHRFSSTGSSSDYSNHHNQTSLSSQPSLASVPSLNKNYHYSCSNYSTASYNCIATLKGHNYYPSSLTLSAKFLYSGSSDREIRSWSKQSLLTTTNNIVLAGKGAVKSLVVHSDKLFSAHQDNKIRVWKITNNINNHHDHELQYTRLATLPTLSDRVSKILLPKNHVRIRRHKRSTWVHHVDAVSCLALSHDGALLYSVSWDRTIKIWRTRDFACLESVMNAHDDAINAVAVSNDGRVYTGSADKRIKVWKKNKSKNKHYLVDTLEKHKSGINALALNGDGSLLYSGACDRSILLWARKEEDKEEEGGDGKMVVVVCLVVVMDFVVSGSEDKTIRVWRGFGGREYSCVAVLEGHRGPIKSLTAMVDHNHDDPSQASMVVYSGSLDCDIKVWKVFVPLL